GLRQCDDSRRRISDWPPRGNRLQRLAHARRPALHGSFPGKPLAPHPESSRGSAVVLLSNLTGRWGGEVVRWWSSEADGSGDVHSLTTPLPHHHLNPGHFAPTPAPQPCFDERLDLVPGQRVVGRQARPTAEAAM